MPSLDARPRDAATHKCAARAYYLLVLRQPTIVNDGADTGGPLPKPRGDMVDAPEPPECQTVYRRTAANCVPPSELDTDTNARDSSATDFRMRAVYTVGGPTGHCVKSRS